MNTYIQWLFCCAATVFLPLIVHGQDTFANPVLDEGSMGLLRGAESNAFAVFSKTNKSWSTHKFADYLTVKPRTLGEFTDEKKHDLVIAFEFTGGTVTELAAVDCNGEFRVHRLKNALNADLKPVLNGGGVIYYIHDEIVYAFSGKTGTWDTHKVAGLPNVNWCNGVGHVPDIQEHGFDTESKNGIVITTSTSTAQFLAENGYWQITPTGNFE